MPHVLQGVDDYEARACKHIMKWMAGTDTPCKMVIVNFMQAVANATAIDHSEDSAAPETNTIAFSQDTI